MNFMINKNSIKKVAVALLLATSTGSAIAQDVHFTQFTATPLLINPAFTGNNNGLFRASAIYRNQWASVTVPFKTIAVSLDAPLIQDISTDDYLAFGAQFYNDVAGDGNLTNFTGLLSVAYHKFLGASVNKVLSVGMQAGYSQKSFDLSKLYFPDEFLNGGFQPGTSQEYPFLGTKVSYYTVNTGISFSHRPSDRFAYTLGVGANNINQPQESFITKKNSEVGLGMRYTAQFGAIWQVGEKFSLRPTALFQSQSTASEIVVGNEFHMIMGNPEFHSIAKALFLGTYYRLDDAALLTFGIDFNGTRLGVSYDYNTSKLKSASNGNGGFEISATFIAPNPLDFARRLVYPCARF